MNRRTRRFPASRPTALGLAALALAALAAAVPAPGGRAAQRAPEPIQPARPPDEAERVVLPSPAPLAERWRYNPRGKGAEGIAAWEEERFSDADAALTRALALAPGAGDPETVDPLLLLNAGTGRLAAGVPDEAAGLLAAAADRAADSGAEQLVTDARYNLGNARYAGGDFAGAADAYRELLRRRPDHAEAKHNLELALRRLAEQRQQQGEGGEESPEQGEGESQDGAGGESGEGEPPEPGEEPPPGGEEESETEASIDPSSGEEETETGAGQEQPSTETPRPEPGESERESPLLDFEEQPDMSAEQAAAILESVESLERQRRQAAAAERARRAGRDRDW